jgi:hypothetical protein
MAAIDSRSLSFSWERGVLLTREIVIAAERMTRITRERINTGILEDSLGTTGGTFFSDAQRKEKYLRLHEVLWEV